MQGRNDEIRRGYAQYDCIKNECEDYDWSFLANPTHIAANFMNHLGMWLYVRTDMLESLLDWIVPRKEAWTGPNSTIGTTDVQTSCLGGESAGTYVVYATDVG